MIRSVYIAAPWVEMQYAREVRDQMVARGIKCTSRWLDLTNEDDVKKDPEILKTEAYHDWADILSADGFLLLNLQVRGHETSGKAVETGIALQADKEIFMVGKRSNVFQYCHEINQYDSVDDALGAMESWVS